MLQKAYLLFLLSCITALSAWSQIKPKREYSGFFDTYYQRGLITYYGGVGMTNYRGDLVKTFSLQGSSFGISAGAHYKLWPHIVVGAELSYLNFSANDFNTARNLSFSGWGFEWGAFGRFYLIDEVIRVAPDKRKEGSASFCKPYIHLGINGLLYNSTAVINEPTVLISREIEAIKYPRLAAAFPVGFGLQFRINNRMSVCPEYAYRFMMTDKLDGIDNLFGETKNDGFGTLMIKFQYAPSAPKQKKPVSLAPPAPYTGPKGTSTWKTRKQEEQKRTPPQDNYEIPSTDDNPDTTEETEEVIEEENPDITPTPQNSTGN
ncbi:MAG: porin family protein [Cytophagaceae bacterium]|jgi:hypothetical protein|nr:porin family protein [Cytophagaceae bacterium]